MWQSAVPATISFCFSYLISFDYMEFVFCPYHFHYRQLSQLYLARMYRNLRHCCWGSCLGTHWRLVLVGLGAAVVVVGQGLVVISDAIVAATLVLA